MSFVLEDIGKDEQGNIIKERRNGSGAKVMGLTLEGKAFSPPGCPYRQASPAAQPLQRTGENGAITRMSRQNGRCSALPIPTVTSPRR